MRTSSLETPKEVCWLCFSVTKRVRGLLSCKTDIKFHAVFEHRVSALLYAYCICEEFNPWNILLEIETDDPNSKQFGILEIGKTFLHFSGSYFGDLGDKMYVQVVPVLIDAGIGTHVEIFADRSRVENDSCLRIERIRRLNILELEEDIRNLESRKDKKLFGCRYISTLISCPNHLLESDNSEKNNDTNYLSAIESLYPLDIVSKLGDIISVFFPQTRLHQPYLPLYCVDRIVSFFSIEDVLRLFHYGLPSKNDFDSQRLKEDIFYSLPNSLISVPFRNLFVPLKSLDSLNPLIKKSTKPLKEFLEDYELTDDDFGEEFWILFNKSMKNPHPYLKNEIKINGIFRPLFVIPIEYQKGYIRNSILRIRSFLSKKNALHLVGNEAIKVQTVSRIAKKKRFSFSTTLIHAIFTDHGSRCTWWYSDVAKQPPKFNRRLKNTEWDSALEIQRPCRRQIIMLTDVSVGEDVKDSLCEISRVEKCLPYIETSKSQKKIHDAIPTATEIDDDDELRYKPRVHGYSFALEDPYELHRFRLLHYLAFNKRRIYSRNETNGEKFNLLSELWKLLADTFGISNYSIIKSEDESTPTAVLTDLVVMSFHGFNYVSAVSRMRLASAHCLRNNKSAISSSFATADDDLQLNVLQLVWDEIQPLMMAKAKICISRSDRLINLIGCGTRDSISDFDFDKVQLYFPPGSWAAFRIFDLVAYLMPLRCRPVQVLFQEEHPEYHQQTSSDSEQNDDTEDEEEEENFN